jgi:hypothetical protein
MTELRAHQDGRTDDAAAARFNVAAQVGQRAPPTVTASSTKR